MDEAHAPVKNRHRESRTVPRALIGKIFLAVTPTPASGKELRYVFLYSSVCASACEWKGMGGTRCAVLLGAKVFREVLLGDFVFRRDGGISRILKMIWLLAFSLVFRSNLFILFCFILYTLCVICKRFVEYMRRFTSILQARNF